MKVTKIEATDKICPEMKVSCIADKCMLWVDDENIEANTDMVDLHEFNKHLLTKYPARVVNIAVKFINEHGHYSFLDATKKELSTIRNAGKKTLSKLEDLQDEVRCVVADVERKMKANAKGYCGLVKQ